MPVFGKKPDKKKPVAAVEAKKPEAPKAPETIKAEPEKVFAVTMKESDKPTFKKMLNIAQSGFPDGDVKELAARLARQA